jgi:branched-subunit amino acid permease
VPAAPVDLININPRPSDPGHDAQANQEERSMLAGWKIVCFGAVIFAVALGAGWLLVPDVVPIGYREEAQPSWAVQIAFALRAIELTTAWVAIIALAVMLGQWSKRWFRPAR